MTQTPAGTTGPVIACIDDSHTVQRQVSLILETSGYEVWTFMNPTAALPFLIANPPHLILLDLNLPGVDGYEICRQLRRSPQLEGVPIVILNHRRNLAWLEEQLGNTKGAIAHYQDILRHDPQDQRSQARLTFLQGL
ncbi:response regulator [Thermosynechococcus sichuanensis E542]|nr:response regulator [Thermosynechococcus vestitus E542]